MAVEIARTEHMVLTMGGPKREQVWCSQWASCGWSGYRRFRADRGDLVKPCPKCGKAVVR